MQKSPDITRTPLGKEVVEILTFGSIQYMLDHQLPLTAEGFAALVEHSRETGLNGRVAFQVYDWTQRKLQELFAKGTGIPVSASEGTAERLRRKPSLRSRLLSLGLGGDDPTLDVGQKQELLERVAEFMGGGVADILEALRHGECQRDLVMARILELAASGNIDEQLAAFRGEA